MLVLTTIFQAQIRAQKASDFAPEKRMISGECQGCYRQSQ